MQGIRERFLPVQIFRPCPRQDYAWLAGCEGAPNGRPELSRDVQIAV